MYSAINIAVAAYNAIAGERGLPGLSLGSGHRAMRRDSSRRSLGTAMGPGDPCSLLRMRSWPERSCATLRARPRRCASTGLDEEEDEDEDEDPHEGLAEGFWREDGVVRTIVGAGRNAYEAHLCSNIRAVRRVSAGDGMDWAVIVKFKDSRGGDKEVRISCGDAVTEPSKCIHELASARLVDPCRGSQALSARSQGRGPRQMFCLLIVSPRRAGFQSPLLTFSRCRLALSLASRKK